MAKILTIIPYSFYPPKGGGALRCFYLLREMSKRHSIYLLTSNNKNDFDKKAFPKFPPDVSVISFAGTKMFWSVLNFFPVKIANALNYRILNRTISGDTDTSFLQIYPVLNAILKQVDFDIVFYENLEAFNSFSNIIKRRNPDTINIYDAHNVDSELWMQKAIAENNMLYKRYTKKALLAESKLFRTADYFFSCSLRDNEKLSKLNRYKVKGSVIPNGVDTTTNPFDSRHEKSLIHNLIFCGSLDYFPNKEGLLWFYFKVFPLVKEILPLMRLTVIGNLTLKEDYKALLADESVDFVGSVESVVPYYTNASVAIVPLKSGSGTRLKILEAMSLGNPVVSTSIGAEGIEYRDNTHLLIADDPENFAERIAYLLKSQNIFNEIRENALQLVHTMYDWKKIGSSVNELLDDIINKKMEGEV